MPTQTYNVAGTYTLAVAGKTFTDSTATYGGVTTHFTINGVLAFDDGFLYITIPTGTDPVTVFTGGGAGLSLASSDGFPTDDGSWVTSTGSGGAGPSVTIGYDITSTPPAITSSAFSIVEGETEAGGLTADGTPAPTFTITGGVDAAKFQIVADSELFFLVAPDFDNPGDDNIDNVYELEITATNIAGSDSQSITITVTNNPTDDPQPNHRSRTVAKTVQELILDEYDPRMSRGSGTFFQATGSTRNYNIGQTLKRSGSKFIPAYDGTCDAVLLANLRDVPTATDRPNVPLLVGGPATINQDELEFVDGATAAERTDQIAALIAKGIRLIRRPKNINIAGA